MEEHDSDGIILLRNQYDFLIKRLSEVPNQKKFENFQKDIWKEMDREDGIIEDYRASKRTPDKTSSVAIMFGDEEYIRRYFLNKRVSISRLI